MKEKRQPTPEQKAAAEERRARLREIWQKVAEMTDDQRAALVEKAGVILTCDGHTLSPKNTVLLLFQSERITTIGGFQQWRKHGRMVKKGEKALGIWIPSKGKEEGESNAPAWMDNAGTPDKGDQSPSRFIFGAVFDITQTEPTKASAES